MRTNDLDYHLPAELIATRPADRRDDARLLVVRLADGTTSHHRVAELPELLDPADVLILNTTAVAPARLCGVRAGTGGRVDGLFLGEVDVGRWTVMLRSNGRLRPGDRVQLLADHGPPRHVLTLIERAGDGWLVAVDPPEPFARTLDDAGRTPIPPYILKARQGRPPIDDAEDRRWYQTVYADADQRRSVAAPTAGLHFTDELLERIDAAGIARHTITLDVGPGTFKPITAERVEDHPMHAEAFQVSPPTLRMLSERAAGAGAGRLVAVGTTSVRTVESLPDPLPDPAGGTFVGRTELLITPPHEFRLVDGLLTNFHLPRSTLLALVAALVGLERLHAVYREAVEHRYRFYSYGDAMLILP